jgi:hypothetical protein
MAGVPFACQASTDHWDSADRTEPMLAAEPTESTEAMEPADPIDKIDPAEPMDRIDPADPMDRIDPLDPMLKMEPSVFRMRSFSQGRLSLDQGPGHRIRGAGSGGGRESSITEMTREPKSTRGCGPGHAPPVHDQLQLEQQLCGNNVNAASTPYESGGGCQGDQRACITSRESHMERKSIRHPSA